MSTGIYLFCLIPAAPLLEIAGTGIDGEHPLLVEAIGKIAAVFSEVDLEDFSGPGSGEHMADLAWVAPRALRHEEVVLSAMERGPVLPVRFGTVFSSMEAAAAPLRRREDTLMTFFKDTIDMKEWTLKGYVDRPRARARMTAARLAAEEGKWAGLPPGRRYFLEQKVKGAADRDVATELKEVERDLLRVAREASAGFSECRLQAREVTGRRDEMVFHGALLVPDGSVAVLESMASQWNAAHESRGVCVELSGPWPPYHFAPVL